MTETPVTPFPTQGRRPLRASGASRMTRGMAGSAQPIEITAPDRYRAALLVGYAAPLFPAEIVTGSAWIVRLELPAAGGEWTVALLSLVERWLESAGLVCAAVRCGGRSYLIRAEGGGEPKEAGWSSARSEPTRDGSLPEAPFGCVELDARRNDRRPPRSAGVERLFGGEVIRLESRQKREFFREPQSPQPA